MRRHRWLGSERSKETMRDGSPMAAMSQARAWGAPWVLAAMRTSKAHGGGWISRLTKTTDNIAVQGADKKAS
jgi:hypothetical protein